MIPIVAYDLDGVLAEGPPEAEKSWGRMNGAERSARKSFLVQHYRQAKVLYRPEEPRFVVVTARKGKDPAVVQETHLWLSRHFPERVLTVYMLHEPRSIENVVSFKSRVLRKISATEFTEDNKKVVTSIAKLQIPDLKVWLFKKDGTRELVTVASECDASRKK